MAWMNNKDIPMMELALDIVKYFDKYHRNEDHFGMSFPGDTYLFGEVCKRLLLDSDSIGVHIVMYYDNATEDEKSEIADLLLRIYKFEKED